MWWRGGEGGGELERVAVGWREWRQFSEGGVGEGGELERVAASWRGRLRGGVGVALHGF